jgi:predicted nucleotidyltransferase
MNGLDYIPDLVERIKTTSPEKIIIFGSYAYGMPSIDSDLDILVVTKDDYTPSSYKEMSLIYLKISKTLSDIKTVIPIDLIVHTRPMHRKFKEMNSLFAKEILGKGKIVYERNY